MQEIDFNAVVSQLPSANTAGRAMPGTSVVLQGYLYSC